MLHHNGVSARGFQGNGKGGAALYCEHGSATLDTRATLTEDAVPVRYDAQKVAGHHDDLGGLIRVIEIDPPMGLRVLARSQLVVATPS